jgi:hypothetical protein
MRAPSASIEWQVKLAQIEARSAQSRNAGQSNVAQIMKLIASHDNASVRSALNEIHLSSAKT